MLESRIALPYTAELEATTADAIVPPFTAVVRSASTAAKSSLAEPLPVASVSTTISYDTFTLVACRRRFGNASAACPICTAADAISPPSSVSALPRRRLA